MGTRSLIVYTSNNHIFTSIYCHWDGYPSHVGKKLLNHYTDPVKVLALMELGSLSSLGAELGEVHSFDAAAMGTDFGDVCTAYGRDRGERNQEAQVSKGKKSLLQAASNCSAEHIYLFSAGYWSWYAVHTGTRWHKLTPALVKEPVRG